MRIPGGKPGIAPRRLEVVFHTPEDVIRFCGGQIASYKAPEHVRIVDELPMTVTGKPQKFVMRDRMVAHGAADADPA